MSDRPVTVNPIRDAPAFRRLLFARLVSHVGDGIAVTALVLLVQETRRSGAAVGALLLVWFVPKLLGPLAGAIVDRAEQRTVMVVCDVAQAAVFGAIAWLSPSFPLLLVFVAIAGSFETLFAPAGRSAVPALVRPEQLMQANAWMGTTLNLQVALGPVIGGILAATLGIRGAIAANALSFLISAIALIGLPPLRPVAEREPRGFLAVGVDGVRYVWRTPILRSVVIALFVGVAFAGLDNVALVFLVKDTLGGGDLAFGLVNGAYGVGMLAGSLGLSLRATAVSAATIFIVGWILSGVGTLLTGLVPLLIVAALGQAVAGVGNAIDVVAIDTLVPRVTPREMLGRVFGFIGTAAPAGHTLAFAAGGFLLDATNARTVYVIAGLGTLIGLAPVLVALRRQRA
jgi:MFS family permease